MELDKALKENQASPMGDDYADADGVSTSGLALQQSEMKKDIILSFLDSKKQSSFKQLENVLDERLSAVVSRYLASSRALTRSFDMYLQKVSWPVSVLPVEEGTGRREWATFCRLFLER